MSWVRRLYWQVELLLGLSVLALTAAGLSIVAYQNGFPLETRYELLTVGNIAVGSYAVFQALNEYRGGDKKSSEALINDE